VQTAKARGNKERAPLKLAVEPSRQTAPRAQIEERKGKGRWKIPSNGRRISEKEENGVDEGGKKRIKARVCGRYGERRGEGSFTTG